MMRYQRVSPDCVPLSNGKKSNLRTTSKEDGSGENGRIPNYNSSSNSFEGKGHKFRSPSKSQDHHNMSHFGAVPTSPQSDNNNNHDTTRNHQSHNSPSPSRGGGGGGGDVLLQWGQKKRSRASRSTETRMVTDESSSSVQARQGIKIQRRVVPAQPAPGVVVEKLSTTTTQTATMPPPPIPATATSNTRIRSCMLTSSSKQSSEFVPTRNLEERSGAGNGPQSSNGGRAFSRSTVGKRSSTSPEKVDRKIPSSGVEKPNGSLVQAEYTNRVDSAPVQSEREAGANNSTPVVGGEKVNGEVLEWPRIYINLSRKEKEDDFLAMKGTKLPQRPKKRAKNIDRALQYCFPGMWLSDLTRSRYEVREKKCVKKQKRRGLKGMESMESDSE